MVRFFEYTKFEIFKNKAFQMDEHRTLYDFDLMQFTGLKDKNGVEIYEGDVVMSQDDEGETHWRDHNDVIHTKDNCGLGQIAWLDNLGGWYLFGEISNALADVCSERSVAIVGNIYENPDLLGDSIVKELAG